MKSGRTPLALDALLLLALPLLLTLAKLDAEATYKGYPNYILMFYIFKKSIVSLSELFYHIKFFLNFYN